MHSFTACFLQVQEVIRCNCAQTWPLEALRQYIAWVKQTFQPALSAEAEEVLLGYWRLVRNAADRQASRSTVRMLESLIRLAQVRPPLQYASACSTGHRRRQGWCSILS